MPITPADIRNSVLLSVATVAASILMLNANATIIAIPVVAFALGWITYRFGTLQAAVVALTAGVVVSVLGPVLFGSTVLDGAYVAVCLLAAGPVSATLLRRYPAVNVAAGIALVMTAAFLVAPIGAETLKASLAAMTGLVSSITGGSVSDAAAVKAAAQTVIAQTAATWPASVFYTLGFGTAIGVAFTARAGRALGQQVSRYGALADLDLSFHLVWPTIAGLGFAAAGTLWSKAPVLLGQVGTNALLIVRPLLFLQGVAVFAALYRRMGAGKVAKTVGLVLLTLTELFVPSVSVVGMADLFANLRRLPRGNEAAPGPIL